MLRLEPTAGGGTGGGSIIRGFGYPVYHLWFLLICIFMHGISSCRVLIAWLIELVINCMVLFWPFMNPKTCVIRSFASQSTRPKLRNKAHAARRWATRDCCMDSIKGNTNKIMIVKFTTKPVGPINSRILMKRRMIRMPTMNPKSLRVNLQIVTMMLTSRMAVKLLDKISLNIPKAQEWSRLRRLRRPDRHLPAQVPDQSWTTPTPWPRVLLMIHLQQQMPALTSAS